MVFAAFRGRGSTIRILKAYLCLCLALGSASSFAEAPKSGCAQEYGLVGSVLHLPIDLWDHSVSKIVHSGAYPLIALQNVGKILSREIRHNPDPSFYNALRQIREHFLRPSEFLYFLGYLALLRISNAGFVSINDMEKATPNFERVGPKDLIVVVNLFPHNEGLVKNFQLEHERFIQRHCQSPEAMKKTGEHSFECSPPRAVLLEPRTYEELNSQLNAFGKGKVTRLDIRDHMSPGTLYFLDSKDEPLADFKSMTEYGQSRFSLAPGGQIRMVGCLFAAGDNGKATVNSVAKQWLPQGGQITASRLTIYPGDGISMFTGKPLPPWLSDTLWKGIHFGLPMAAAVAPLYAQAELPGLVAPKDMYAWGDPILTVKVPESAGARK
jgi:hypothetical protein